MQRFIFFLLLVSQLMYGQDTSAVISSDLSLFTLRIVDIFSASDDDIRLSIDGANLIVHDPGNEIIGDGTSINPNTRSFLLTDFTSILIETRTGSDSVTINAPLNFMNDGGIHITGTTAITQNASMVLDYGELSYLVSHTIRFTENAVISASNTATIELMTQDDIHINGTIQQNATATGGDLTLISGWDGITPFNETLYNQYSSKASLTAATPFGNSTGSIYMGDGNQTKAVILGNRFGKTNVYSYNLQLNAGDASNGRYVQLGYPVSDQGNGFSVTGQINVRVKNDLVLESGVNNQYNYTQIGHVGADQSTDTTQEANVNAAVYFAAGNRITVNGGNSIENYSQIGHGGHQTKGNFQGEIQKVSITTPLLLNDNNSRGYGRLGHDN